MIHHVKRGALWAWGERARLLKYLITGVSAVCLDQALYIVLTRGFDVSGQFANIVAVLFAGTAVFFVNKYWSFNRRADTIRQSRRFVALFIFNYFFAQFAFHLFVTELGWYDIAAKLGITALSTIWNFLLYRFWIYGVEK